MPRAGPSISLVLRWPCHRGQNDGGGQERKSKGCEGSWPRMEVSWQGSEVGGGGLEERGAVELAQGGRGGPWRDKRHLLHLSLADLEATQGQDENLSLPVPGPQSQSFATLSKDAGTKWSLHGCGWVLGRSSLWWLRVVAPLVCWYSAAFESQRPRQGPDVTTVHSRLQLHSQRFPDLGQGF